MLPVIDKIYGNGHQRLVSVLFCLCWLSSSVLAGACSALPWGSDDDWIETGTHPAYPTPRFMLGIGYGDTMKDADDMARAELSKSFSAKVTTVSLETDSYRQKDQATGSDAVREFQTRTFTRVKGQAVLEDVRIADRRLAGDRHYSLAVVDAQALRAKWGRKLAALDGAMEESLAGSGAGGSARIKGIAGALRKLVEMRALEVQLRAIGGSIPAETRDAVALFGEMQALLMKHHPIVIEADDPTLKRMAGEAMADAWLVVGTPQEGVEPVVVRLGFVLDVRKGDDTNEMIYTVTMEATQSGRVLAQRRLADRLMHKVEEMGRQKTFLDIRDRLLKPFAADLATALLGGPITAAPTQN